MRFSPIAVAATLLLSQVSPAVAGNARQVRAPAKFSPKPFTAQRGGVAFSLSAKAVHTKRKGKKPGWGIAVLVVAKSQDGKTHGLVDDPLMFSARYSPLCRRVGKSRLCSGGGGFGEGRGGTFARPIKVRKGQPALLKRTFPSKGRRAVVRGQRLDLTVNVHAVGDLGTVRLEVPKRGKPTLLYRPHYPKPRSKPSSLP